MVATETSGDSLSEVDRANMNFPVGRDGSAAFNGPANARAIAPRVINMVFIGRVIFDSGLR